MFFCIFCNNTLRVIFNYNGLTTIVAEGEAGVMHQGIKIIWQEVLVGTITALRELMLSVCIIIHIFPFYRHKLVPVFAGLLVVKA